MKCRIPPGHIGHTKTPACARVVSEQRAAEVIAWCEQRGAHVIVEIASDQAEWLDELERIGDVSRSVPKTRVERRLLKKQLDRKRKLRPR